jgi:Holliday junction DNA helicase RuvB
VDDIKQIVHRSAGLLGIEITPEAVDIIARASRGTPRAANRLLKRARDFAQVRAKSIIDGDAARDTLAMLEVDEMGLEPQDRRLLTMIIEKFNGGPVGINTIAAALSEDRGVIEEIYEPYLLTLGFLQRSSAGRIVLPAAYRHLKIKDKGELL